jgi:hypothetical protein
VLYTRKTRNGLWDLAARLESLSVSPCPIVRPQSFKLFAFDGEAVDLSYKGVEAGVILLEALN